MGLLDRILNRTPQAPKKAAYVNRVNVQLDRMRQDAETRRNAIREAEQNYTPFRVKMQQLYLNTIENGYVSALVERRKDLTLLRKWAFIGPDGVENKQVTEIFCNTVNGKTQLKRWFNNYLDYTLDALFYGYSLISLGDIENGEFNKISVVPRWYVSPDRYVVTSYPYLIGGTDFRSGDVADWHVYVDTPNDTGISPCGYGLLYRISVYEILLRNILGFNGDFVELFAQPIRVGKTNKTEEAERAAFEDALAKMGSAAYIMLDEMGESVELISSQLGGTGYQGYDNFEKRLEAKVAQLILGHADAMSSIPGKLGNSGDDSPAERALKDKQTKDGAFILPYVNQVLFSRLRKLGFNIPDGVTAVMLNDNEEHEQAERVTDIAVKIKQAGLQVDGKWFTEQTKIPVADIAPTPQPAIPERMSNRLKEFYG